MAFVPAAAARTEPPWLTPRPQLVLSAVSAAAFTLHHSVEGDGIVHAKGQTGAANFSLDLGRGKGAKVLYYDAAHKVLFHDVQITSILWGPLSVSVKGIGSLNGKHVPFTARAVEGTDTPDVFELTWKHTTVGGTVLEGSVSIG